MRFLVLCNGDEIGEVEFSAEDVARGSASAVLLTSPAFERYRPVLERAHRAMHQGAARLFDLMMQGQLSLPSNQGFSAAAVDGADRIDAIEITPDQSRLIGQAELAAAMEPAAGLQFALREASGAAVTTEDVYVWTAFSPLAAAEAPRVTVTFQARE